jgi:hypothetical protein
MKRWWWWLTATVAGLDDRGRGGRSVSQGGRAGGPVSPYEPSDTSVPAQGDGRLVGGSFEGRFGDGWDACGSKHPGLVPSTGEASDGAGFLLFDSSLACERCAERKADLQVVLWFATEIPAGAASYLYFDVADLGDQPATGTLAFSSVHAPSSDACTTSEVLAKVPLEQLYATPTWQTRCVAFTPQAAFMQLGLYVADGTFEIGLDALRFGPPCR